jgi:hypothetical protein
MYTYLLDSDQPYPMHTTEYIFAYSNASDLYTVWQADVKHKQGRLNGTLVVFNITWVGFSNGT